VRKNSIVVLTFNLLFLTGCIWIAGGSGSLKSYDYNVPKDRLDAAVKLVVETNSNIYQDTIGLAIPTFTPGKGQDTIYDNSYNDGVTHMRIYISGAGFKNRYSFRYGGTQEHWDTSNTSGFFIVTAFDNQGNGGSEANGGVNEELLKQFTNAFEAELVDNIDKELNTTRTERY
jgi:hypothetical protein